MNFSPRDVFLTELLAHAEQDDSIILMSVDMGAPALDLWRERIPNQVLDMGIAEQNAINVAAGLSKGGKKVFVYFMAVWVHRCFEQIRYSCCIADLKVNIIGNGVGMGYAPAGPAHQPNEDIALMRSLHNMSIFTGSSIASIKSLVNLSLNSSKSNYLRLDRKLFETEEISENFVVRKGWADEVYVGKGQPKYLVVSYGYMSSRIKEFIMTDPIMSSEVAVLDLIRLWPLDLKEVEDVFKFVEGVLLIEEQSASGSISETIVSSIGSLRHKKIATIHLPNKYLFDNLDQEGILNKHGFDKESIFKAIKSLT